MCVNKLVCVCVVRVENVLLICSLRQLLLFVLVNVDEKMRDEPEGGEE